MKIGMKITAQLIIGAMAGFLGSMLFLGMDVRFDFSEQAYTLNLILVTAALILGAFAHYWYFSISQKAGQKFSGEEEDEVEGWMYRRYSDATLSATIALLLSLLALSVTGITQQPMWLLLAGIAGGIISFAASLTLPGLMKKMYPERNIPSIGDKKYADKLLEISDDGEKYVMLGGLYKTYYSLNGLLTAAIFLLLFYSIGTGTSQLFSIFVLVGILIVTNAQYIFSVRNK